MAHINVIGLDCGIFDIWNVLREFSASDLSDHD